MSESPMTPERLAEIRDLLRYESSIAFYSHRAKESMLLLLAEAEDAARLRARVADLEALELGDPDSRVSATCENPHHPTWLRAKDDPRGCPWCELDKAHDNLIGANLSLYEEEQETARLRLAWKSAQRGRRELRARVADLEDERHSTNESLSEAAEALRRQRDRIEKQRGQLAAARLPYRERAKRETSPARRAAWLQLAAVEESEERLELLLAAPADDAPSEAGDGS